MLLAHGRVSPFHEWFTGIVLTDIPPYDTAACPTLHAPPLMEPQGVLKRYP